MTRYRVLHTITTFPQSSGAAENTKLTLNLLDRRRFEPFLATAAGQSMDAEVARDVVRIPLRWLRRAINPLIDSLALAELYSVIRRYQFHVVHTHNAKDGIVGRWAARLARTPVIVHTVHNVSFHAARGAFATWQYKWHERWAARISDRLVAVSAENASALMSAGVGRQDQYRVIYSGLDLSRYKDDHLPPAVRRMNLGLPERDGPWVAWIGRFNPQKDPLTFVRAAQMVSVRIPGVQFIVCGDDPINESLLDQTRALVNDYGLGDVMHFIGFQREVTSVLRAVDLLMHSSRYEGMGRVVCEALACGRPVAGTSVDGVVEVIESGSRGGLLSPPNDPTGLANAAVKLLEDKAYARRLATAGQDWVTRNLSVEQMVKAIEGVYTDRLNGVMG